MKFLPWNIAKKDFRQLWGVLLLWWVVLVLRAAVPALTFDAAVHTITVPDNLGSHPVYTDQPFVTASMLDTLSDLLVIADVGLLGVIVCFLMVADWPHNHRLQWRTLPISSREMFGGKILFLAIFCGLVPVLIQLGMKMAYGMPVSGFVPGVTDYLVELAAWITMIMLFLAVFPEPLWTLGIGFVAIFFFSPLLKLLYIEDAVTFFLHSQARDGLIWLCAFLEALALIAYMFRRRRPISGVVWFIAGLACLFALKWYLGLFEQDAKYSRVIADKTEPAMFTGNIADEFNRTSPKEAWLLDYFLSPPLVGERRIYRSDQSFNNATFEATHGFPGRVYDNGTDRVPLNFAEALQELGLGTNPGGTSTVSQNKPGLLQHLSKNDQKNILIGGWNATFVFKTGTLERITDLPLQIGAHEAHGPYATAVTAFDLVQKSGNYQLKVTLYVQTLTNGGWPLEPTKLALTGFQILSDDLFVLWNPQRHEVIPAFANDLEDPLDYAMTGNGLALNRGVPTFTYNFPNSSDAQSPNWTQKDVLDWIANARIVRLHFAAVNRYAVTASQIADASKK